MSDILEIDQISVRKIANGYIVKHCELEFAFTSRQDLLADIEEWTYGKEDDDIWRTYGDYKE